MGGGMGGGGGWREARNTFFTHTHTKSYHSRKQLLPSNLHNYTKLYKPEENSVESCIAVRTKDRTAWTI